MLRFAWPPPPWQSLLAAAGVLLLLGVAGVALGAHRDSAIPAPVVGLSAVLTLGFLPAGLIVVNRRPRHLSALLIAAVGLLALLALATTAWSGLLVGAWLAHWTWWLPVGLLPVLLMCYPNPPATDRARGWLDVAAFAAAAGAGCLMDAAAVSPNADLIEESRRIGLAATILTVGWLIAALITTLSTIGAVIAILLRARRAGAGARRWSAALVPALVMAPVGYLMYRQGVPWGYLLPVPFLGVGLAAGVLPDPHGRGDRWWQRGLTAVLAVAAAYLIASAALAFLPPALSAYPWVAPVLAGLAGTALAATSAPWWWRWLGSLSTTIRYGDAPAAYTTLADGMPAPQPRATVGEIAQSVMACAGVAGVRVRAELGGELVTVAEAGADGQPHAVVPIDDGSRVIGVLEATCGGQSGSPEADEHQSAILHRAARRAAEAIAESRATWEAMHGHAGIVAQRDHDRQWIRAELHDTFLPTVQECQARLEAARLRMPSQRTAALLDPVIDDLVAAGAAVCHLMGELRPDVLERGLFAALNDLVAELVPGARVAVDLGGARVPAPVEVAAYRIIRAALRHAAAHEDIGEIAVRVVAHPGQGLDLTVLTQGGPPGPAGSASEGTASDAGAMRAWAQEVGGRLTVISSQSGTRLSAALPLPEATEGAPVALAG
ncbi:MAG: hypothetical protein IPI32_10360 [Austwickia sp.]|nr:hypothetical protein [Austwickia sp.]MBK8436106.1 hypothetical protein [Austwickia sp.]MBK9101786.1 hypothetical protein [Austwickia sp.]